MTRFDIEERRLRRLEKRIRHLTALLRVTEIFGGPAVDKLWISDGKKGRKERWQRTSWR